MEFSRLVYWSGLRFPPPGDLPDPGIEPGPPALQVGSLPTELTGEPYRVIEKLLNIDCEIAQSCLTLCDPMDCSPPGSSIHGIFQARILEWVAISFSRGSSWPRNWTQVSHIAGRLFTIWATRESPLTTLKKKKKLPNEIFSSNLMRNLRFLPWTYFF